MSSKIKTRGADSPKGKSKSKTNHRKLAALRAVAKKFDDADDNSPKTEEATESIFAKHLKRLRKLEADGIKGEAYDLAVLKSMRTLVQDLIPVAEDNYRKFPIHTAAAALNHYINQERELMNDIRALEDFRKRAGLLTKIIDKEMQGLTKIFIEQATKLQADMSESHATGNKDAFKSFLKLFGREMQTANETMGDKVMEYLVSDDKK